MKKYVVLLLFLLLLSLSACTRTDNNNVIDINKDEPLENIESGNEGVDVSDNRCILSNQITLNQTDTITSLELWTNSSVCDNLIYEDGYIQLDNNTEKGTLETGSFYLESFDKLVPSWNILIDDYSKVSILISLGNSEGYSDYYVMALWQSDYKLSFKNQEDEYGKVSIDTITSKKDDIDRIKFKVVFAQSETDKTKLKNISITTVLPTNTTDYMTTNLNNHEVTVIPRQQLSIPLIGNSICSPTSLSMVLNYYGYTDSQEIVASNVYDNGSKIYGNWSFNASYAGGFDLYSRVEYVDNLSVLMNYINEDIPLILSIMTKSKEALEGSIMAYPSGHLVVLTGFVLKDDTWYAIINDPAEYEDALVRREYKLDQILDAWRGYIYVVQETEFE